MTMFKSSSATTAKEYIAGISDASRRKEIGTLHALILKTAPGLKPHIQSGMIAYGTFHYKYATGREGDWFRIGLANNKNFISLYLCVPGPGGYVPEVYKSKLGKVSVGKSCIRIKKLADVKVAGLRSALRSAATAPLPDDRFHE